LNETLRQACCEGSAGICDWQFPGLMSGGRNLHYRTVTTSPDPEEGAVFAPDVEYRVWVVQSERGAAGLPGDVPVLADTSYLVPIQQQETDRFLFTNVYARQEGEVRTDALVTRRAWTQSEACVLRLLRRVREGRAKSDSIHLYFHDQDGRYTRIPVAADGELHWTPPSGFFAWRSAELF
jgi:hypothetical protein